MKTQLWSWLVVGVSLCTASSAVAQTSVGALAIDARQGDQWGWAVDYETAAAARDVALRECGSGCSVVLTFERCGAYAVDQDAASTAVGWGQSYASSSAARETALRECRSRGGGSGCVVRVWGCNGPVVEEALGLDRAARRQIQQGLQSAGFAPGGADGMFGPRTRAAIRGWQSSRAARPTGYLDGAAVESLRSAGASGPAVAGVAPAASPAPAAAPPAGSPELEGLFWQSIMNSTNAAEFEAYLRRFPTGLFSELAQARLAALRSPAAAAPGATGTRVGSAGAPASGSRVAGARVSGAAGLAFGAAAGGDVGRRPGEVFRDCEVCPEMVVLPGGGLALGRYEVTVGEYRAFASATGGGGNGCELGDSWRDPGFPQTDRHPVTCVSWDDAQAYVSWLSRTTGVSYRLPTEAEWDRAAGGSQAGCYGKSLDNPGTCPVGSYGSNAAGLSDMVGNLWEWTEDSVSEEPFASSGGRVTRGAAWTASGARRPGVSSSAWNFARSRTIHVGFRVSRTLD